ncbi:MAG: cation efflux system protein [Nitrospirales bacterium]|nr:MAG: cation efflux system protein [Nitrospirales bacterium]
MIAKIVELSLGQRFVVCSLGFALFFGGLYAYNLLDIAAYPDPSPPMVEVITQYPGWSAEDIERQITIPIEIELTGMPGLTDMRSRSLFGLSDIKIYFEFGTDWYFDRQQVLNRLAMVDLPQGAQVALSPWWSIAEIYRYELAGEGYSLTELKTLQDWVVSRQLKQVPGVIDVTAFGGTTKQYHVDINPGALISYKISLPQVMDALSRSNVNVGGNYLGIGAQNYNVRGIGLIQNLEDIEDVVVAQREGTPVFVKNLGRVSIGHQVRLGKVGIDDREDVVEGVVLLRREAEALPVLEDVKKKVEELNTSILPEGVQIVTFKDRSALIHTTVQTVTHILITGMILVFLILYIFLGHFRSAVIVALTIPLSLLFTFLMMVLIGQSANLVSLGAIDFGIIVDSSLIMVESIFYHLAHRRRFQGTTSDLIVRAAKQVGRPIFFSTAIIVVAFIPLFTMMGVPGKIFAPMSITYGFALLGALLMACTLAPVLCSFLLKGRIREEDTAVVRVTKRVYQSVLSQALDRQWLVIGVTLAVLLVSVLAFQFMGGEFMPALEEGNLSVRATMPVDISFDQGARIAGELRKIIKGFPEVISTVSQLGRPDDGTDPTTFYSIELISNLKPLDEWRSGMTKQKLIAEMEERLQAFPGISFNYSQFLQDSVEEAMSGVKSENSIKLFGPDLRVLEEKALEIEKAMSRIDGVKDLGIFHVTGQPNLVVQADRKAAARYGLHVGDVNAVVSAAIGGQAVTKVLEGERWFDLVVRFLPEFRRDIETIKNIRVDTPDGVPIPLKQVATVATKTGGFLIYRENHERYIPIKFSVRGRDLASTVQEAQSRLKKEIELPEGYHIEWAGQYDQLQSEQKRLIVIVPISLVLILYLLYIAFNSGRNALLVLATIPFALIGGVFTLVLTGTPFSISAAVGVISTLGVSILGGMLLVSRIVELQESGKPLREAILEGAELQMRPILMATLGAALGLLPAAVATGIGSQTQQPLARVVVGGMLTATVLILIVLPVLYQLVNRNRTDNHISAKS